MTHTTYPFNEKMQRVRRSLVPWTRPALDIMAYQIAIKDFRKVMHEYDHSELRGLVNEVVIRLDPYKAPEQYHLDVNKITDFLYQELHRNDSSRSMTIDAAFEVMQEMERQEAEEMGVEMRCQGCGGDLDVGAHGIIGDGITCAD